MGGVRVKRWLSGGSPLLGLMMVLAGCAGGEGTGPAAVAQTSFAATGEVNGDRGAIQGFVLNSEELPIVGAELLLRPSDASGVTALDGGFSFSLLEPGAYTLFVSLLGYHAGTAALDIQAGETTEVLIQLKELTIAKPRTETIGYTGFLECRWAAFGSGLCGSTGVCLNACYTTEEVAKLIWTNDKNDFFFQLTGEDWQDIVLESRWQGSSAATSPKMIQLFSYKGRPGNHAFGSNDPGTKSPSWWKYEKGKPGQNERFPPNNPVPVPNMTLTLRAWLAVSGDLQAAPYTEEDPAGIAYQTKFDSYATVFYSSKAKEGYTAWKD